MQTQKSMVVAVTWLALVLSSFRLPAGAIRAVITWIELMYNYKRLHSEPYRRVSNEAERKL
ncbi:hypothetical protein ACSL103130_09855 [Actinomyces slackii]|uniref:Uncharacterized protein n=1 Tax=Actinomyces slackii TaxID=52774 RepID=A0A3S4SIX3_9ACTO|nr:hypothetical protein [Actinomyces slackii]VEG73708.1 Uncharacterised protein [Actinomyces slackii]